MRKKLSKSKYYILAFLIPIAIIMLTFFIKGVWFNGERLSFGDMQAQYSQMIIYFRKILLGQESVFYSFTKGLGGDMYATATYYMISPFNLIALLFKEYDVMQAIYYIILGKIGLSGLTMFIFLKSKKYDNVKSLIFSICYSLMAFVVNNYFCIMWLDAIYMLPLVIMGLDKIIEECKPKLYIIMLSLSLLFSFYMGYMMCIFCIIYFIYKIIITYKLDEKEKIKKCVLTFILSSILSGLLTSFIWLPSIIELLKTSREGIGTGTNVLSVIKTLFIGSYTEETLLNYYQPNLYCGVIIYILIISFLVSKKNDKLKKGLVISVICIFIASILINFISYIWHGFSYPIGYNYRFTYLFCFFLIIIAIEEFNNLDYLKKRQKLVLFIVLVLILIFMKTSFDKAWITLIFFILYSILLSAKFDNKIKDYVILIVVIIEFCINTNMSFYPAINNTTYKDLYYDICKNIDDDNSYRVSGYNYYGVDEMILCSKSSTKGFYSTINNNIVKFYNRVGYSSGANVYDDNQNNTPIISSLLGVKTIYSNYRINNYKLVKEIMTKKFDNNSKLFYEDKNYIYENEDALSLGYMIKNVKNITNLNPYAYQNELLKQLSGNEDDILKEIVNERKNENLSKSKYIYILMYQENNGFTINGVDYAPIEPGVPFKVENNFDSDEISLSSSSEMIAYYIDNEQFKKSIDELKKQQLSNIKISKNKITANIDSKEDGTLMLSIPYEDGINVYVDSKKVKIDKIYDMFIGLDIKKGKHKITIKYETSTYIYGLIVSGISLIVVIIYIKEIDKENFNEKRKGKNRKK